MKTPQNQPEITAVERERGIFHVTIAGSIVNILLLVFKFVAGFVGHSSAMIADAVHSLSDFVTDVIVIIFVRISSKPRDNDHAYGHGKFETFATLLVGFILLLAGLLIAWNGGSSIVAVIGGATLERPGSLALWAALASIVIKELLYRYTVVRGRALKSDAVIANAWHHRSDALSSIATAIGIGGAVLLGQKWTILDPIAALFVSFFIARTAIQLMKPCIDELTERTLPADTEREITEMVHAFAMVHDLHNLHTRKIGNSCAIEFHIRLDGATTLADAHTAVTDIEDSLRARFGNETHVIIHMEPL